VPEALEAQMESHFFHIRKNFHELTPDQLLVGGEEFDTAIGRLVVCWTSGHSPGHICLHSPERRLLFSGDQILPGITPNIAWHPGRDMLAEFLESLDRLAALEVDLIFPGHGEPFSGHRAWVTETIGHHGQRCDEIFDLLRKSPRSVHSMVGDLWRRSLSPINHHFAVFEVLAHLEYMRRQGRVGYRPSIDGVEWHA
jgi:glyoxylase-like metal-dependent hydrolase (beta-lactamase superfamily II)